MNTKGSFSSDIYYAASGLKWTKAQQARVFEAGSSDEKLNSVLCSFSNEQFFLKKFQALVHKINFIVQSVQTFIIMVIPFAFFFMNYWRIWEVDISCPSPKRLTPGIARSDKKRRSFYSTLVYRAEALMSWGGGEGGYFPLPPPEKGFVLIH